VGSHRREEGTDGGQTMMCHSEVRIGHLERSLGGTEIDSVGARR
jgi:hypothetical protein